MGSLPLYRQELLQPDTETVILTGSIRGCDALLAQKIPAVAPAGVEDTPGDEALRPLLGQTVFLWPTNNAYGHGLMKRTATSLLRLGHQDVRMIEWKGALVDWGPQDLLEQEGWKDELDSLVDAAVKCDNVTYIKSTPETISPAVKEPMFVSLDYLMEHPRNPVWLVRGFIEIPSSGRTFGAPGSGKTFAMIDLAAQVATGGRWMGRRVTQGAVFYLCGEGYTGVQRRFQAWRKHHKVDKMPGIYISSKGIPLNAGGALLVSQEIERMSAEAGVKPLLVIVDTVSRHLPPGADENSTKDMGDFIRSVDSIKDALQCVTMVVHHTGHSEKDRARGASVVLGAIDVELQVLEQSAGKVARWRKLKDSPMDPEGHQFTLGVEKIGEDPTAEKDEESVISSCYVEWGGKVAVTQGILTPAEKLGMETLRAAIAVTDKYSATLDEWRDMFYEKHWGETPDTKRKSFRRTRESLANKDLVLIHDGNYSVAREGIK